MVLGPIVSHSEVMFLEDCPTPATSLTNSPAYAHTNSGPPVH